MRRRHTVVHLHVIQAIEARHLIVMLAVEQRRGARLEAGLRLCVLLLWCVVRALCLLLDRLRGARGICGAAAGVLLVAGCPAHGLVGLCCVCLLIVLKQLVHRVETDVAADIVFHVVGLHLGQV